MRQTHLRESLSKIIAGDVSQQAMGSSPSAFDNDTSGLEALQILLVEDNVVNQTVALRILERIGCKADAVDSGFGAIAAITAHAYDIVLMDVQMPEMDGLETTRRIRAMDVNGRQPWIIALTANAMLEDRTECLDAGMSDYVSKPIEVEKLLSALQRGADSQRRSSARQAVPVHG